MAWNEAFAHALQKTPHRPADKLRKAALSEEIAKQGILWHMEYSDEPFNTTLGVASLNVLYDKTRTDSGLIEPQDERVVSIAHTLGALPIALDALMLQEVQVTHAGHNGERIADLLALPQRFWFPHNRKGEHLGICGSAINYAEAFDIGDNRKAIVAGIGNAALFNIHHRSGTKNGPKRIEQMKHVLNVVDSCGTEKVIIAGDSNDHSRHESRRMLRDAGFVSVFKLKQPYAYLPPTFPTTNYRNILLSPAQRRALPFGVAIDILEVRGFSKNEILQAGTVMTEKSDHKTLYAKLRLSN